MNSGLHSLSLRIGVNFSDDELQEMVQVIAPHITESFGPHQADCCESTCIYIDTLSYIDCTTNCFD